MERAPQTLRSQLQLSHVHSNVETASARADPRSERGASIEPRSFKRGNTGQTQESGKTTTLASIEPRSFKRGNIRALLGLRLRVSALQLSHVHSNVETPQPKSVYGKPDLASIEPRSFKRGNSH